jgi:hypothetical protein
MNAESSDDKKRDPRHDRLVELLKAGSTLEDAAKAVGVSSRQVRNWRTADPDLDAIVLDAMCFADDAVEAVTFKNCIDPDPAHNTLRMFWLKSRRPEIYREQAKDEGSPAPTVIVIHAPDRSRKAEAD